MDKEILIIDGDEATALGLKSVASTGWKITARAKLSSGMKAVSGSEVVLLAGDLPDGGGLEGLRRIKTYYPDAVVIVAVPQGKNGEAARMMREGAFCTIEKPLVPELAKTVLKKASLFVSMREEIKRLKAVKPPDIVCKSPEMLKVLRQVERASATDEPVFIAGEEGTGKELIARAVHLRSRRKAAPFVSVSASGLLGEDGPQALSDCRGGTLFVRGIEDVGQEGQEKLLKLASDKELGTGGGAALQADLRVVFGVRDDSGFDWVDIKIPPLRRRKEDIHLLSKHFLKEAEEFFKEGPKKLSKEAEGLLLKCEWPGNVRELKSVIKKAYAVSKGGTIEKDDIIADGMGSMRDFFEKKLSRYLEGKDRPGKLNLYQTVISEAEKALIEMVLQGTGGNKVRTSDILGVSRNTLASKIKKYRIKMKPHGGGGAPKPWRL